ncbi:uncharacterized protein LOC105212813 [Zeugodacus cucurbitae]|uniref:Ribosomal protein S6 kinase delta-1 n=1 Tax=Zeugodacus cucurbitae TaxID=28588 RepID=A0A0A1X0W4_ZEUCU|nr:uncharacterized protein LOC105212813 [Zeugodacus cucurbitae]
MSHNVLEHIFYFATLFAFLSAVEAVKYDFVVENEDVFTPCEDFPDKFIDTFFDISGLSFEREDDLIKVTGDVKLIHEFDKAVPIQFDAQIYRRSRGEWVDTIYNIRRPDLCPSLYSENEMWYQFTKVVPEKERKCPPQPGFTLSFNSLFGLSYDLQDRSAEGEYKVKAMIGQGKDIMCFEIEASVYKSD